MYRYVYCITRVLPKSPRDLFGVENASVHTLQYHDIVAIVSEVTASRTSASNENVLRHAAVIEIIQREQTTLPIRFSSIFKNDEEVLEFLKKGYTLFLSDLERLHNKLEMGLRIMRKNFQQNTEIVKANDGQRSKKLTIDFGFKKWNSNLATTYLEHRRTYYKSRDERNDSIQEIVRFCHAKFEDTYTECRIDTHIPFLHGVSLNYLIHKDALLEFRTRFNDLLTNMNEFQFLCSGPWPPYHFVSSLNQP